MHPRHVEVPTGARVILRKRLPPTDALPHLKGGSARHHFPHLHAYVPEVREDLDEQEQGWQGGLIRLKKAGLNRMDTCKTGFFQTIFEKIRFEDNSKNFAENSSAT